MYRVILVVALWCAVALAQPDEECKKLHHPSTMHCCKKPPPHPKEEQHEEMKECFKTMSKPPACDVDICIAKKRGFAASDDGKFDKTAVKSTIEEDFQESPEMAESIIKNCVDGDLSEFGPPDFCDLTKLRHCIQLHMLLSCPEWDNSGKCAGIQELITKCKKQ